MNMSAPEKIQAQMEVNQAMSLLGSAQGDMANEDYETVLYAVMRAKEAILRLEILLGVRAP